MYKSIKYKVPDKIKEHVTEYLKTHNVGNRGEFDGNYVNQWEGLVGECVVYSRLFKKMLDLAERDGFDGGIDLVYKSFSIDVKTMGRRSYTKENYANNFTALQKEYPTDILVFCSYNRIKEVLEICGWIYKFELETKGVFRKEGEEIPRGKEPLICSKDMYEIENKDLYPFELLEKYSERVLRKTQYAKMYLNDSNNISKERNLEKR